MQPFLSRRSFLSRATSAACAARVLPEAWSAAANTHDTGLDFPLVDFHVHLDHSQLDQVLALARERGVRFGIVEHAGTRENQYPVVLSNDEELAAYVNRLDGKPVFKGVQAEWNDWRGCFSAKVLARLDYVLTDAMTFPGKDGQRVKLWEKDVETRVDLADKQQWMDRYVQWHVEILTTQPIDIFANTSWLPAPLAGGYDAYWTPVRVKQVVAAAVAHDVALEISSSFKLPQLAFLQIAKAAGAKFSLGSNGRYPDMGRLDYAVQMARALKLTRQDIFSPAPEGPKAVQRRKL